MIDSGAKVETKPLKHKIPHNLLLLVSATVVILVGLIIIYAVRTKNSTSSGLCDGKETSKIYNEVADALYMPTKTKLRLVVERIQADNNYQKDPSCMYIVTRYYTDTSDVARARESLNNLKKVYRSDNNYVPQIKKYPPTSIKLFETEIGLIEERAKNSGQSKPTPEMVEKLKQMGINP